MSVTKLFRDLASGLSNGSRPLIWLPQYEMGYCPTNVLASELYNEAYFRKYESRSATEMGKQLTRARLNLLAMHYHGQIVDIGIGSGQFMEEHRDCEGYDVNPLAVTLLKCRGRWRNPYATPVQAVTCWDSLEHLSDPEELLRNVKEWVFVSLPIFRNAEHALKSKHFKPDEHLWYWTHYGFVSWMRGLGFCCLAYNKMETELGREDIETFVFRHEDYLLR